MVSWRRLLIYTHLLVILAGMMLGSWLGSRKKSKKMIQKVMIVNGNVVTVNTQNCVIEGADKLIATVGLRDMIVVVTKDATLISTKENAGRDKEGAC